VRKYQSADVPRTVIERCLDAARLSTFGGFGQSVLYRFLGFNDSLSSKYLERYQQSNDRNNARKNQGHNHGHEYFWGGRWISPHGLQGGAADIGNGKRRPQDSKKHDDYEDDVTHILLIEKSGVNSQNKAKIVYLLNSDIACQLLQILTPVFSILQSTPRLHCGTPLRSLF